MWIKSKHKDLNHQLEAHSKGLLCTELSGRTHDGTIYVTDSARQTSVHTVTNWHTAGTRFHLIGCLFLCIK